MPFSQSIIDLIRKRTSVRSYVSTPIDSERQIKLNAFMADLKPGPFGSAARFKLVAASENSGKELRRLGTYGFIKNATGYIISALKDEGRNLEDLGYQMEEVILYATELGLGTCWLGGTFTKSSFASKMDLGPGELIPAVTATGIPTEERSKKEERIRSSAHADRRWPMEKLFFEDSYGNPLQDAGEFHTPLEMVRLAPSASNRQPWRVVKQANSYHFYLERTPNYRERRLNRMFTNADMQRIDMGIAMCHFELSARELGLPGEWVVAEPALELPEGEIAYLVSWVV